jgi:hypothetical protein
VISGASSGSVVGVIGGEQRRGAPQEVRAHHLGDQREEHVVELVEVPDDDRGDAGLEAFSMSGCAYQCYAPEGEPLTMTQRYNKQRDKMTADVGKFIANTAKIQAWLLDSRCVV